MFLIIANCHDNKGEHLTGILPTDITDHFFHLISSNKLFKENVNNYIPKRIINSKTILHLKNRVQHCDWNSLLDFQNADTAYNYLYDKFKILCNECLPLEKMKSKCNIPKKPWSTQTLLDCIKKKNKLYKAIKLDGNEHFLKYYKSYRNKLTSILHQSEKDYYKHQLDSNKNNLTKTWKTLRMIIHKKKTTHQNTTFVNGIKISNNSTIANLLNKYFVNTPRELCKAIPTQCKDPCSYVKSSITESLYLNPATESEICEILLLTIRPLDMMILTLEYSRGSLNILVSY